MENVLLSECLKDDFETLPSYLKEFKKGDKIDFKELLKSRIVYNPGAGTEGSPIRVFNTAHAAHFYIYVDYGFTKSQINNELSNDAF